MKANILQTGLICAVFLGVIFVGAGHGDLTEQDLSATGDGLLTHDSETGLCWLDLTDADGEPYEDIEEMLQPGGEFRYATEDEVSVLWAHGKIEHVDQVPPPPLWLLASVAPVTDLQDLLGAWSVQLSEEVTLAVTAGFIADPDGSPPGRLGILVKKCAQINEQAFYLDAAAYFRDESLNEKPCGHWLVREEASSGYMEVLIDIRPGSDSDSINLNGKGVIPVAILGSSDFDVATVDPSTVTFGPGEATECHGNGSIEDVNGDGFDDMVLHFRKQDIFVQTQDISIQSGNVEAYLADEEACLTGETVDDQAIQGCDAIVVMAESKARKSKKAPGVMASSKLTTTWGKIKSSH